MPIDAFIWNYTWQWLGVTRMDTAKDARVLVLEDALHRLNEVFSNRKLKTHLEYGKLLEYLKTAGSLFYEVKYSYQNAELVADLDATTNLVSSITELEKLYRSALSSGYKPSSTNEHVAQADVEYSFRTVKGFRNKLKEFDEDPAHAIDILAVEVTEVSPIKGSKNLSECRCTDGSRIWKIVTNIVDVKTGVILPCAVLPPVEMMDVVSEAMFLGGTPLPEDTQLGLLRNPSEPTLNQARAQVMHVTERMT